MYSVLYPFIKPSNLSIQRPVFQKDVKTVLHHFWNFQTSLYTFSAIKARWSLQYSLSFIFIGLFLI